jgi:YidC/Oxa1 family membrane protein insertase
MKPSDEEIQKEQALQDSLRNVREGVVDTTSLASVVDTLAEETTAVLDSAALAKPFGASTIGQDDLVVLENDLIKVELSTKGGKVKTVELKGEANYDGNPLYLVEGENNEFGLLFNAAGQNINTDALYFTAVTNTTNSATLRLNYSDDQYLEYNYTLEPDSYNVGLKIQAVGIQNLIDVKQSSILVNWQSTLLRKELNIKSEREKSTVFFKNTDKDIDHLSEAKDDTEKLPLNNISSLRSFRPRNRLKIPSCP